MKLQSRLASGMGLSLILVCMTTSARADDEKYEVPASRQEHAQIEPTAGNWRTWVISSGKDYRVAPPPGRHQTKNELQLMARLISRNDAKTLEQIAFWDAGAPAYRWLDMINARILAGTATSAYAHRV